jgi:hypothetical protein
LVEFIRSDVLPVCRTVHIPSIGRAVAKPYKVRIATADRDLDGAGRRRRLTKVIDWRKSLAFAREKLAAVMPLPVP